MSGRGVAEMVCVCVCVVLVEQHEMHAWKSHNRQV
jgi:hypothetical protein